MKYRKSIIILSMAILLTFAGCSQGKEKGYLYEPKHMIRVDGKLYISTGKEIPVEMEDTAILGTVTSWVKSSEIPRKNGESNFSCEGAEYALFEDGLVVLLQNEWVFFEEKK